MNTFGEKLKTLRVKKGLTQLELAKILDCADSTIRGWESNRRELDFETLKKIADIFNVSIDFLLGRNEQSNNPNNQFSYKSELHKELINLINIFDREDLLLLKGYMTKVNEKYELRKKDTKIG